MKSDTFPWVVAAFLLVVVGVFVYLRFKAKKKPSPLSALCQLAASEGAGMSSSSSSGLCDQISAVVTPAVDRIPGRLASAIDEFNEAKKNNFKDAPPDATVTKGDTSWNPLRLFSFATFG